MSRIADAHARAGITLPDEDVATWERERPFAEAHLEGTAPAVRPPKAELPPPAVSPVRVVARAPAEQSVEPLQQLPPERALDFELNLAQVPVPIAEAHPERAPSSQTSASDASELAEAVRRIFLSPRGEVRSVLFCTTPGDRVSDVAWQAAEILAGASGKRVAFVEDGSSTSVSPAEGAHGGVTRIGWYANEDRSTAQADTDFGEHVSDLFPSFDFVIVNAAAPTADDLVPLAREVDGVVILVDENETRVDAAEALVTTLRGSQTTLLGAILTTKESGSGDTLFNLRG